MAKKDFSKRENRPAFQITGVFPTASGEAFPPPELVSMACQAAKDLLGAMGFTQVNVMVGLLGRIIKETPLEHKRLLDEEGFKIAATENKANIEAPKVNEAAEKKVTESKISIDEMLKGIDLNRTSEKGN